MFFIDSIVHFFIYTYSLPDRTFVCLCILLLQFFLIVGSLEPDFVLPAPFAFSL